MLLDEPLSPMDVDAELWSVLDLCSDEELEAIYTILHATSPFSPILKSLVVERDEPALVALRGRRSVMHKVESHFRFLAAGSTHLLRGARPSYREVLLNVRDKLDVRCSRNLTTYDLETEIFLHCLNNCAEYVSSPPPAAAAQQQQQQQAGAGGGTEEEAAGSGNGGGGDGVGPVDPMRAASFATISTIDVTAASPSSGEQSSGSGSSAPGANGTSAPGGAQQHQQHGGSSSGGGSSRGSSSSRGNWTERVTAPFRLGLKDLAPTLLNFAGVVTVTKVGQQAAAQLASNLVCSHVRYQAALRAATGLGMSGFAKGAVASWSKQAVLEAAARSLTSATARYSALRGALSFVGPLLWGWLAVDLALKAIGPDYARVVRAVFLLSQVRLVRTHGFVSGEMAAHQDAASRGGGGLEDEDDYYDPGAAFM